MPVTLPVASFQKSIGATNAKKYDHCAPFVEDLDGCCQPDCCQMGGFVSGELLYWRTFQSGLDICVPEQVSDIVTADGRVISRFKGRGRDPHFNWDPGFRIGAGYRLPCTNWDVRAFWTHFNSHSSSKNHDSRLRWNINLNVLDVIAGYDLDFGYCFNFRPFFGLRGAKIDQKLRVRSSPDIFIDDFFIADTKSKEKFTGLGPLIGLEADWNIGCGFSLYTMGSVAWMYGKYNVRFTEFDESFAVINLSKIRNHLDASLACADAAIGIRWETCFYMNTRLLLQLGLEHHRYFDYNRLGNYGDLSFDGVNLSAAIGF